MYVVSVLDNGEERNFLEKIISLADAIVIVDVGENTHEFLPANLIDIVSIDENILPLHWALR